MARYIDADILLDKLYDHEFITLCPLDEVSDVIDYCPTVDAEPVVHCEHCTIKKAVQHQDGIVWRCPHRTGDVKMEGYCESGVRADERFGEG